MIRTFLKMSWRNALKNRSFTLISLCSLILGITLFFLISCWASNELSYDTGFASGAPVCRVETNLITPDGGAERLATVGWPIGRQLTSFPEVEALSYLRDWRPIIRHKEAYLYETALLADEQFFAVFGYALERGNPATALKDPYSIVISQEISRKYFGNEEALGKTLVISDSIQYRVTGILAPKPERSHLKFDMLGSFSTYCSMNPENCDKDFSSGWFNLNVYNYVKLRHATDVAATEPKFSQLMQEKGKEAIAASGYKYSLALTPVQDIYLHSGRATAQGSTGNFKMVKLFGGIGIFILLIACLNFINLSTAKSVERAKEIGVQKVLGNSRGRLVLQFLTEAAVLCILAALVSLLLVVLLIPPFNSFTGKSFGWMDVFSAGNLFILLGIIILLIPLAGFYPAWVLSAFKPVSILKRGFMHTGSGVLLRKVLVVKQFIISAGLIMSTIIMWKQMTFMQNRELGFNKEKVLLVNVMKVPWALRHDKAELFKTVLKSNAGIKNVTACNAVPGLNGWNGQFAHPEGRSKTDGLSVEYIPVDADYVKTIGLSLCAGRDFLPGSKADEEEAFIINETAVRYFGWETADKALGKKLSTSGKDGRIIGVLKDYHQHGVQKEIRAIVLSPVSYINLFALRYEGIPPSQAIDHAKVAWEKLFSGYPMEFSFLDEGLQKQYSKEDKLQRFLALAAVLAIVIGSLGLFGLVIYTAQKRVKEIGVRKVLGASVTRIVQLLSVDLLKLVGIAVILTIPLAWWLMHQWLQQFAFRITISWWVFVLAGAIALLIALLTISVQAIRSAIANPVRSLRND